MEKIVVEQLFGAEEGEWTSALSTFLGGLAAFNKDSAALECI